MNNLQDKNISANNFEQCLKCTVCTVYCPIVPVNPNYPGPKQAGPDGERLRLKRGEFFDFGIGRNTCGFVFAIGEAF